MSTLDEVEMCWCAGERSTESYGYLGGQSGMATVAPEFRRNFVGGLANI